MKKFKEGDLSHAVFNASRMIGLPMLYVTSPLSFCNEWGFSLTHDTTWANYWNKYLDDRVERFNDNTW